jgi:methyltransferase-like protein
MPEDNSYSIKEFLTHAMEDMKESIIETHSNIKEVKDDVKKVLVQTTEHNHRMTKLEVKTSDYVDYKKKVDSHENKVYYVTGAIFIITLIGGFALNYLIDKRVDNKIIEALANYE